jgi:hypothetical protein
LIFCTVFFAFHSFGGDRVPEAGLNHGGQQRDEFRGKTEMKNFHLLHSKRPCVEIGLGQTGDEGEVRYALSIVGRPYEVFFRSPEVTLYPGVEPLLVLALLPAMRVGADLLPAQPIGQDFSVNLVRFMEIFGRWFKDFRKVDILGERGVSGRPRANARVGAFFSGGVDSFYTLLKHQNEITDLVYVHGFDLALRDRVRRKAVSDMCRAVADRLGKGLVEVETNAPSMVRPYSKWGRHAFGAVLACVGHLLSSEFSKIYIASGVHQDALSPWGSHPDTDPLLGSQEVTFIHDGCEAQRTEKIEAICEHKIVMDHLRVCWENVEGTYNCGKCEKCLRTMISLYAIGKLGHCRTLPARLDQTAVRNLLFTYGAAQVFARENLSLLEAHGLQQAPIYAALQVASARPLWQANLMKALRKRKQQLIRFASRFSPFRLG